MHCRNVQMCFALTAGWEERIVCVHFIALYTLFTNVPTNQLHCRLCAELTGGWEVEIFSQTSLLHRFLSLSPQALNFFIFSKLVFRNENSSSMIFCALDASSLFPDFLSPSYQHGFHKRKCCPVEIFFFK